MVNAAGNEKDQFSDRVVGFVESNDFTSLRNVLHQQMAEDTDASAELCDALDTALQLGRYEMAQELFKHGAEWSDCTMGAVLEGARQDNDWNVKAIDLALENGWDINKYYEYLGSALGYVSPEGFSDRRDD
jgi:hypothetical protein